MTHQTIINRRAFAIGVCSTVAGGLAVGLKPTRQVERFGRGTIAGFIPETIGPWQLSNRSGVVDNADQQDDPELGYDEVVRRIYVARDLPDIYFLAAYGVNQAGSQQLHRPETCYPGQGFSLSDVSNCVIPLGPAAVPARRMTAVRDLRRERLLYWTRIADQFPQNSFEEYAVILGCALKGFVADGILVRFSAIGEDVHGLDRTIDRFVANMMSTVSHGGRHLLLGNGSA